MRTGLLVLIGLGLGLVGSSVAEAEILRIEIDKSERVLRLYSGTELLESFPVGLGFEPVADKVRQGDGATPEGEYFICVKNPHSAYYLSVGINYPNALDARQGREDGVVTLGQEQEIVAAETRGICPPWNTPLGGEIFIHGRGSSQDWTLGCVALDDPAMKTLFERVEVGTVVTVIP